MFFHAPLKSSTGPINWTQNPCEVNPPDDITGLRRDLGNAIAVPHVGEDLPFHELQFIQLIDRGQAIADLKAMLFLKSFGI
jgi:hypothetical protein